MTEVLVLIKHALPEVRPGRPPSSWPLSDSGRDAIPELAARLRDVGVGLVFASTEPKATETGRLAAALLGVPFEIRRGLQEQRRDREPFEEDRTEFETKVRRLFDNPSERVYGDESAQEALDRFASAVEGIFGDHPQEAIAVVAHGTVISLYVASRCGIDGFDLWKRLATPSFVVLETPSFKLVDTVERFPGQPVVPITVTTRPMVPPDGIPRASE